MTLILGIRTELGAIMSSDSAATYDAADGSFVAKQETPKLFCLNDNIVWGASGPTAMISRAAEAVSAAGTGQVGYGKSAQDVRNYLIKCLKPCMTQVYSEYVPVPGQRPNPPVTDFLFACLLRAGPCLISIDRKCIGEILTDSFYAIGSGAKAAHVLMTRCRDHQLDLKTAEVVAYRAVDDAIRVEPYGLGPPIQMRKLEVTDDAPRVCCYGPDELRGVSDTVALWSALEREALTSLGSLPEAESTLPVAPQTIADVPVQQAQA